MGGAWLTIKNGLAVHMISDDELTEALDPERPTRTPVKLEAVPTKPRVPTLNKLRYMRQLISLTMTKTSLGVLDRRTTDMTIGQTGSRADTTADPTDPSELAKIYEEAADVPTEVQDRRETDKNIGKKVPAAGSTRFSTRTLELPRRYGDCRVPPPGCAAWEAT